MAMAAIAASQGPTQTQWCSQLTGEISKPVSAQVSRPSIGSPSWCSQVAQSRPTTAVSGAATSQGPTASGPCTMSLASTPRSDWFHAEPKKNSTFAPGPPLARSNRPVLQYVAEAPGIAR